MSKKPGIPGVGGVSGVKKVSRSVTHTPNKPKNKPNNKRGRPKGSRNRGGRNSFEAPDADHIRNENLADALFTKDTSIGMTPSMRRRLSAGVKRLQRKILQNMFKGKKGRREIQRAAEDEKARVHDMAKDHITSEVDELYMSDSYMGQRNALTKGGIYNGLSPGQQALLGEDAWPQIRIVIQSPKTRGIDIYNAGIQSHDAAEAAIGRTLQDLADSWDFIMDTAQTFQQLVDESDNNNN